MKINFTHNDILRYYRKIKNYAFLSFHKNKYDQSLKWINIAAQIAYNFNFIYADEDLEKLIYEISSKIITKKTLFRTNPNRFVFYDVFGSSSVLAIQYVQALISHGYEFLFILEFIDNKRSKELLDILNRYDKAEVFFINHKTPYKEKIQNVYDKIIDYAPHKALLHLKPWSVEAICIFNALSTIKRYQINLTDHAFWLGVNCTDFCIEFRTYGATISIEKRGIPANKLLMLPYYPIIKTSQFEGFPLESKDKVIIFSGGNYYKIYGEQKKYFNIVKKILMEHPSSVILFAGDGDSSAIKQFIRKYNLQKRFILLGYRKDINEVFANCDIYLATFPITGGLMSQYAAINGKPILSYTDANIPSNIVEDLLPGVQIQITHTNLEDFFTEAAHLITNKKYRKDTGELLKSQFVTTLQKFNMDFQDLILNTPKIDNLNTNSNIKLVTIDYNKFSDIYLEVENKFFYALQILILKTFKFKAFFIFPKSTIKFFIQGNVFNFIKLNVKKAHNKIINIIKYNI